MRVPIKKDDMPGRGDKVTDGKRLMEVESLNSSGEYSLTDCSVDADDERDPEIKMLADEMVAECWEHVRVASKEQVGA